MSIFDQYFDSAGRFTGGIAAPQAQIPTGKPSWWRPEMGELTPYYNQIPEGLVNSGGQGALAGYTSPGTSVGNRYGTSQNWGVNGENMGTSPWDNTKGTAANWNTLAQMAAVVGGGQLASMYGGGAGGGGQLNGTLANGRALGPGGVGFSGEVSGLAQAAGAGAAPSAEIIAGMAPNLAPAAMTSWAAGGSIAPELLAGAAAATPAAASGANLLSPEALMEMGAAQGGSTDAGLSLWQQAQAKLAGMSLSDWLKTGAGIASLAGTVAGNNSSNDAITNAANISAKSAADALAFQKEMWQKSNENQAPWLAAGTNALSQLTAGTQPGGNLVAPQQPYKVFGAADFQADPGSAFRFEQGLKAIQNSAAGRGGLLSGAALKGITRYGQDYGTQEWGAARNRFNEDQNTTYNRDLLNQTNNYNRLAGLAGTGQNAANQLQSNNTNYGNAGANTITTNGMNQGNAQLQQGANNQSMYGSIANQLGQWSSPSQPAWLEAMLKRIGSY